jgi:predicted Co/Zn/Cd cation transporter (cation efflux family)
MAKVIKEKRIRRDEIFPFEKQNYLLIGSGLVSIIAGYLALLEKTVDGFLPLYIAPILLVLGYCVLIPLGIIYTRREKQTVSSEQTFSK